MKLRSEMIAVAVTLAVLFGVPWALIAYARAYLPRKFPGASIVSLTAVAADGVWTREPVTGATYWRKRFHAVPTISVDVGQPVVLRLASADALHSFAIPALEIGPIDVPAGEVRTVAFTPREPGMLLFLCWRVCAPLHGQLLGRVLVLGPDSPSTAAPSEPDLR